MLVSKVQARSASEGIYPECLGSKVGRSPLVPSAGCGGRKLSDVTHDQPSWLEYAESEWGYGRVKIVDGGRLEFQYIHSESGKVRDSFVLDNARGNGRQCGVGTSYFAGAEYTEPSSVGFSEASERKPILLTLGAASSASPAEELQLIPGSSLNSS